MWIVNPNDHDNSLTIWELSVVLRSCKNFFGVVNEVQAALL